MRAVVLSGGSSKGAYAAGCLEYLMGELRINYDIYTGVSSGGISCSYLAQFKSGQEALAAHSLKNLWLSLNNDKIYRHWRPFGFFHAIYTQSLYDATPMHNLIKNNINISKIKSSGKIVQVGSTNLSSGKFTLFDGHHPEFINAVIAGASFPAIFKGITIENDLWSDGGIKTISPISAAIALGSTDIDLIITHPVTRIKKFIKNPDIFDIFMRSLDLATDKIMNNDIEKILMYNRLAEAGLTDRKVIKLNIFQPSTNLTEDLLDFSPSKIREMLDRGYNDTKINYKNAD